MSASKPVMIRKLNSELVLDASEKYVKLQSSNRDNPYQIWNLEHVGMGLFVITNTGNEYVLDIEEGAAAGKHVITYGRFETENQLWYINSNHTIVSSSDDYGGNWALEVENGLYQPGSDIIVNKQSSADKQVFVFEYLPVAKSN